METFVQTKVKPEHMLKTEAIPETQPLDQKPQPQEGAAKEEEKKKTAAKPNRVSGVLPAIITTLLLIPLMLVISIGLFVCWRRNSMYCMTESKYSMTGFKVDVHFWALSSVYTLE